MYRVARIGHSVKAIGVVPTVSIRSVDVCLSVCKSLIRMEKAGRSRIINGLCTRQRGLDLQQPAANVVQREVKKASSRSSSRHIHKVYVVPLLGVWIQVQYLLGCQTRLLFPCEGSGPGDHPAQVCTAVALNMCIHLYIL